MEARLGGADRNVENSCGFLERKIVLVAKKEDCSLAGETWSRSEKKAALGGPPRSGSGVKVPSGESLRGCQRWARLRWLTAMCEAIRRAHARKTAGSRKNGSLRKIWIEVS